MFRSITGTILILLGAAIAVLGFVSIVNTKGMLGLLHFIYDEAGVHPYSDTYLKAAFLISSVAHVVLGTVLLAGGVQLIRKAVNAYRYIAVFAVGTAVATWVVPPNMIYPYEFRNALATLMYLGCAVIATATFVRAGWSTPNQSSKRTR